MKQASPITFESVIESSLDQLVELCSGGSPSSSILFYGQMIIHFLRGESEGLRTGIESIEERFGNEPDVEYLRVACLLRERIRQRAFDGQLMQTAESLTRSTGSNATKWRGELCILLATAQTVFDQYERALDFYALAAKAFTVQNCHRKALRSRMNMLVCESHIFPNRNLFARYHDLYRQALRKENRELIVATTCLLNISREYQRAGAYLVALKYCNRALSLFELQMGELNYFLTLVHRAHLLCMLGRKSEARLDFDSAKLGQFPEVEAALGVVESLLEGHTHIDVNSSDLLPNWRDRAADGRPESLPKLSTLEDKLLELLSKGPRDRVDLINEIYGENLDFETRLNRFKSLLSTIRKKLPDLILCEEGQYRLADQILLPSRKASRQTGS